MVMRSLAPSTRPLERALELNPSPPSHTLHVCIARSAEEDTFANFSSAEWKQFFETIDVGNDLEIAGRNVAIIGPVPKDLLDRVLLGAEVHRPAIDHLGCRRAEIQGQFPQRFKVNFLAEVDRQRDDLVAALVDEPVKRKPRFEIAVECQDDARHADPPPSASAEYSRCNPSGAISP